MKKDRTLKGGLSVRGALNRLPRPLPEGAERHVAPALLGQLCRMGEGVSYPMSAIAFSNGSPRPNRSNVSAGSSAFAFISNPLFAHYIGLQLSMAEKALTAEAQRHG